MTWRSFMSYSCHLHDPRDRNERGQMHLLWLINKCLSCSPNMLGSVLELWRKQKEDIWSCFGGVYNLAWMIKKYIQYIYIQKNILKTSQEPNRVKVSKRGCRLGPGSRARWGSCLPKSWVGISTGHYTFYGTPKLSYQGTPPILQTTM